VDVVPYRIDPQTGQKIYINAQTGQPVNMTATPQQSTQQAMQSTPQAQPTQQPVAFDMGSFMQTLTQKPNTQVQNPSAGGFAGNVASGVGNMATGLWETGKTLATDMPIFGNQSINSLQGKGNAGTETATKLLPQFIAGIVNGFYKLGASTDYNGSGASGNPVDALKGFGNLAYNEPVETAATIATVAPVSKLGKAGQAEKTSIAGKAPKTVKVAPFGRGYNPEIVKVAEKYGVELPASAQTSSKVVRGMEATAQKGFFGEKTAKGVETAYKQLDVAKENVIKGVETSTDLKGLGNTIKEGFTKFEDEFKKTKTQLYNEAKNPALSKSPVDTASTSSALKEILDTKSKSLAPDATAGYYREIMNNLSAKGKNGKVKPVTYQQLKETRSAVGKKLSDFNDPIATGDKATLEKLYASLSEDMDSALQLADPATFEKVQKANTYYKETLNKINSDIGKKIANKDPEKLMDELIRPNSETAVKQVKEVIGPEATTKLQQQFMARLVNDSIDKNGFISNTLLEKNIAKYTEPTIKELLDSQQYEKIQFLRSQTGELSGVEDAIKSGVKPAEGSQTAFLGKFGTMGAAMFVRPDVAIGILLSDFGLNKLFQSGFGKELMTKGVDVKVPSVSVVAPSSTAVGVGGAIESGATQKPEEDTDPFAGKTRKEIFDLAIKQGASSKQLEDLSKSYDISQQKPADEYVETKSQEDGMYSPGQLAKAMYKARVANDTASYNALKDMYELSVAEEKRTADKKPEKKLTDKQRSYSGAGALGSEILSILETSPDSISTGPIAGRLSKVGEITGKESEKQTQLKSKIASARTAARNALLGANMSDKELESYLDATFDITLPAPILLARVKTFVSDMKTLAQTDTTGVATDEGM
jgi:translation elongation factor P/translation initiation factor 5A